MMARFYFRITSRVNPTGRKNASGVNFYLETCYNKFIDFSGVYRLFRQAKAADTKIICIILEF